MAEKPRIPKSFWRENPLEEYSTAMIAFTIMTCFGPGESNEELIREDKLPEDIQATIKQRREQLEAASTPDAVIKFMRGGCHPALFSLLVDKVEEMEDEVVPMILRRYRTSTLTSFIEAAAFVLHLCDNKYIDALREGFREIRSPYARSQASVVLGLRKDYQAIPMLLEEYEKMLDGDYDDYDTEYSEYIKEDDERKNHNTAYEQGPLLALYLLYDVF